MGKKKKIITWDWLVPLVGGTKKPSSPAPVGRGPMSCGKKLENHFKKDFEQ